MTKTIAVFLSFISCMIFSAPVQSESSSKFTVGLYKNLAQSSPGKNLVYSPFSVEYALSMVYIGANGTTKSELASTLDLNADVTAENLGQKVKWIHTASDAYIMKAPNALFVEKNFTVLPEFKETLASQFGVGVLPANFETRFEKERARINAWVEDRTGGKIQNILPQGSIDPNTQLVLVSALYFIASWSHPFSSGSTFSGPFNTSNGQPKMVQMMTQQSDLKYGKSDELGGAQLLKLPYMEDEMSMIIILPKESGESHLRAFESGLTAPILEQALGNMHRASVKVFLPKFKIEASLDFAESLKAVGVKSAFTAAAELQGISKVPLKISKVVQKVFIDVNEQGTEAASATATILIPVMRPAVPWPPVTFTADHPFLFLIRHKQSKSILFMGRVNDPTV